MIKPGDIVRYSPYPHVELHSSGMTGLVLSKPRVLEDERDRFADPPVVIDVIWNMDRGLMYPAGTVCWEYIDELEVINESW